MVMENRDRVNEKLCKSENPDLDLKKFDECEPCDCESF